jgi:primosomal protein N' (replication factor Y)
MKIVTVIPLSKGIFKEQLSYFTSSPVHLGSLVTVPVRTQSVHAVVTKIEDAHTMKAKLKSAPFSIKKIEKVQETPLFSPALIEAAQATADHFATTTGAVIDMLVPKSILEAYTDEKIPKTSQQSKPSKTPLKNEHYVFQSDDDERMATYKSFIRESFAKKESVFFCLPSAQKIEHTYSMLEKGIAPYTFILHGKLTPKEILTTWQNILASQRPVLVIATGNFLSIPREDLGAIIIDLENSNNYKTIQRPFIDYRVFAEQYAEKANIKLIFGDVFLRVETLEREKQKELVPFAPLKYRMLEQARQYIVDMQEEDTSSNKKTFTIVSNALAQLVAHTKENNEHLFVLTSRRGLNPVTVCGDCGSLVQCSSCSAPMTLHKKGTRNIFVCHKCGNRKATEVTCENCSSWKLTPLGVGSQLVEKEILRLHPDAKVFRLDSDSVTTHKKALALATEFLNTPGAILVGTEMAVSYVNTPIENIAVASIDPLFALPDFRGNERIFNLLLRLYTKATKNFIIQTRNPSVPLFTYITKGNLIDFYRDEISERKDLGYPPFKTFIKITREGNKETVVADMKKLTETFKDYEALAFPAFIQEIKNKYRMHLLIKLDRHTWIDRELLAILRSLPPLFSVNIDPENLL